MAVSQRLLVMALVAFVLGGTGEAQRVTTSDRVQRWVTVRRRPVPASPEVGRLARGASAELVRALSKWYRVRLDDGTTGYVSRAWTRMVPVARGLGVSRVQTVAEVPAGRPAPGSFRVHLIDVGTGLAILLQGADFTMLYDGGSKDDQASAWSDSGNGNRLLAYLFAALGPSGRRACTPRGDAWGARADGPELVIDHLVLSHPHDDHGNLLADVLRCYRVEHVWDGGVVNPTKWYEELVEAIAAERTSYHTAIDVPAARTVTVRSRAISLAGSTWTVFGEDDVVRLGSGASFQVLHESPKKAHDYNQNSLVLAVDLGGVRVLLTGDAESGPRKPPSEPLGDVEEWLVTHHRAALDVDILQVGHHGSMTSSRRAFLDAVSPKLALIGVGPHKYHSVTLPDPEVLSALEAVGATVHSTAEDDASCPAKDRIGVDDARPGGCASFVVTIGN